jgi:hypothetical protein
MRLSTLLSEVRDRPVPEGMPDPALLTFKEYEKVANPSDKSHESDSYQATGSLSYHTYENFRPLRRFQSRGIDFELMVNRVDSHHDQKFVKHTPEGNIVRNEKGEIIYMSPAELDASGYERYGYTFGIFYDKTCVGAAQDEWGALLILVVQEFQGFGLGPILGKVARKMEPYADSGGFTPGGHHNLRKVHQEFVREYMQTGMYSHLVRSGQISVERAKEIIASAQLEQKPTKKTNVGPSGEKYLWSNNTNAWIVYDKNLKNAIEESQKGRIDDLFAEKLIHAYCFTMDENPTYLYQLGYNDKKSGKIVLEAAMAEVASHDDELRIRNDNWTEVWERVRALGYDVEIDEPFPESDIPNDVFQKLSQIEQSWRKSFDQYDEFGTLMQELADRIYNP